MKKKILYNLFIVCLMLTSQTLVLHAQQHPLFTQYMFNGLVVNPAYTGSHESMSMTASLRKQWTGIKGAPETQALSIHAPIKVSRSSAGFVGMHDKVGVTSQFMMYGTYAYRIPVSENGKIALGGQAGITHYRSNFSELDIVTRDGNTDNAFATNESRVLPNLGLGIYYHDRRSYVGLSLPTVINNKWNNENDFRNSSQQRHYLLSAGHVFDLHDNLKLKPNVLLRWAEGGPFQYDLNANMLVQDIIWIGVSYRMNDSVDGLIEWNVNEQLSVGYSYGYATSRIASSQSGTHEIVLNYRLKKDKNIVLSPRYF